MEWQIANLKFDNATFDITPNAVNQKSFIRPNSIVMFTCKFNCEQGEKPSMKISDVSAVCEIIGGPTHEYKITA